MKQKKTIFKRKFWEGLSVTLASLVVVTTGGYNIAMSQSAAINHALGISGSEIDRSDAEEYQYFKSSYSDYATLEQDYQAVAEQVEGEGLVLLKNDNGALPLTSGEKVSCLLTGSVKFNYASSGSSATKVDDGYSDLKKALTNVGLSVNSTLWDFYTSNLEKYGRTKSGSTYMINEIPYENYTDTVKNSISEYGTAIVNIARDSGEGSYDVTEYSKKCDGLDGSYLSLSQAEIDVLKALTEMKQSGKVKKIVVLLNASAGIQLDFLDSEGIDVDACLWIGNVGKFGINAVAKSLVGKDGFVPSGKLTDTYLKNNFSSPAMAQQSFNRNKAFASLYENGDHLNDTQAYYGVYSEGIYVGYRYYETRYTDYVLGRGNAGEYEYSADVAYSFGYGKSYTDFEYSNFQVQPSHDGKKYDISVTVTNVGDRYSGKETVEIYLQKPYVENGVEKAAVELVAFDKTDILAPGEDQTVRLSVSEEQFKSYDMNNAKTYIVDAGTYYLTVANGAHEAANNILAKRGYTVDNTNGKMDAEGDETLVYATADKEYDAVTYSKSTHTGKDITNQLEFADLNKYEGSDTDVTYVSRSDWQGTWPKDQIVVAVTDKMNEDLKSNKPIAEDPNAEMPTYGEENGLTLAALRGKEYDDEAWDKLLNQMSFADQAYLLTNAQMTTVAVSSVGKPDTKENDGPTGVIGSLKNLSLPSQGIWAASFNKELIQKVGNMLAEDARAAGYTGIYANGINMHRTSFGGRSHEYFSEDPYLSGISAVYEIRGIQEKGVIANVKHLAFNDQESQRNGICMWLNEQEAREIMLLPFEYALSSQEGYGNAHAVMTGFNRIGTDWAGANTNLLMNIMRDEWGFDGYCITDMASSNGAVYMTYQDGILLGTDCFLGSGSKEALNAFKNSPTYCQRMREAAHRILYSVCNYSAAMNGLTPDTSVGEAEWWWRTAILAVDYTFASAASVCVLMWAISCVKTRKKKN